MVKLLNNLLMIGFFIILYLAIKKYNKKQFNNPDSEDIDVMKYVTNKNLRVPFKNNNDTPYHINFDYELAKDDKLVKQFHKEQKEGVNTTIKYPNRFIVKLDENDQPIWSDYAKLTGNPDNFIDNRILFGDNLSGHHIKNLDGRLNPDDDNGKTLKDIYDNHVLDFKDLIPKNELTISDNVMQAASNLSYMDNDNWKYKDEKPENGGELYGYYASDPTIYNTPAIYTN